MRILGLDLGARRIGLAVSDPDERIASPAGFLERRGARRDLAALCALIGEREIGRVVVGLPIHMNGSLGPEARAAEAFARSLADAAGLPVETLDERLTTREAEQALREGGVRPGRRRALVDAVAASILLRTYLERRRNASGAGA